MLVLLEKYSLPYLNATRVVSTDFCTDEWTTIFVSHYIVERYNVKASFCGAHASQLLSESDRSYRTLLRKERT